MLGQPVRLARPFHFDDAHPRPDQVDEPAAGRLLEPRDLSAFGPVAREQLVEEGLRLRSLRSLVLAPAFDELEETAANLLARQRHVG